MIYPNIDMKLTGLKLKKLIQRSGYDVKDIQKYLHLSCPQPIYRWFKGKTLPSVDHLYALSVLFGVHMEELIVSKQYVLFEMDWRVIRPNTKRFHCYYKLVKEIA